MERFQPQRWLRIFGIAASTVIAARFFVDQIYAGPLKPVALTAQLIAFGGFLAAFVFSTRSVDAREFSWLSAAVLLVQLPLGLMFGAELAIVATTAVPFLLAGRAAWIWLASEIALMWLLSLPGAAPSNTTLSPGLAHTPFGVALAVTAVEATAWILFSFCAGYLIVRAERNRRELLQRNAELEATHSLLAQSSALNERLRISRELHDAVGHHLVGLSVNLELASHMVDGRAATPVHRALLIARLLLAEVRETVSVMREDQHLDLAGALRQLASGAADLRVHLDLPPECPDMPPPLVHFLFRCAQEALTNTRKHARARNLWISVRPGADGCRFSARDDGRGAADLRMGNGLTGMRERAEELGASFAVQSADGGFAIEILAPCPAGGPL